MFLESNYARRLQRAKYTREIFVWQTMSSFPSWRRVFFEWTCPYDTERNGAWFLGNRWAFHECFSH